MAAGADRADLSYDGRRAGETTRHTRASPRDDAPFVNQDDVPKRVVLRGRTWWWLTPFLLGLGILLGCIAVDYALNGQCHLIRLGELIEPLCANVCSLRILSTSTDVGMSRFAPACFVLAPMAIIAAVRAPLGGNPR